MKSVTLYLSSLIILISCSREKNTIDKNLIYFNSKFLSGDEKYEYYKPKIESKPNAQYLEDLIYVTGYIETNACGKYVGNLKYKNDSIILLYKLVSKEVCGSTSIEKASFIIKNPKNKKYKFRFDWE